MSEPMLLSPEEAARALGCGRTQLYRSLKEGKLKSIRLGRLRRIPRSEIEAFIEQRLRDER